MTRFKWAAKFNGITLASGTTLERESILVGASPTSDVMVDREDLLRRARSNSRLSAAQVEKLVYSAGFVHGEHGEIIAERDFHGYRNPTNVPVIVRGHFITRGNPVKRTKKVHPLDTAQLALRRFVLVIKNPDRQREAGPHLEIHFRPIT